MGKRGKRVLIFLAFLAVAGYAPGQPLPHFQQVFFNHQSVNPAYTAIGENRGFFLLLRNQLSGEKPAGYSQMLSLHTPVFNNFIGAGLDYFRDRTIFNQDIASPADSTYSLDRSSLYTHYSYELMVAHDLRLRLGGTFGVSSFEKTGSGERNMQANFGIGAFLYGENGAFTLAIPRLMGTNPGSSNPADPITLDQRIFYFGASAFFSLSEEIKLKPAIFYAVPFGLPAGVDLCFILELKEKIRLGTVYRVDGPMGVLAQAKLKNNFRIGLGGNFENHPVTGKGTINADLSLSYDVDIYGRKNRPPIFF